jgi:hypothetical protein
MTEIETLEQKRERVAALRAAQADVTKAAQDAIDSKELDSEERLYSEFANLGRLGYDFAGVISRKTGDLVVVKAPSKVAYRTYQSNTALVGSPQAKLTLADCMTQLVQGCVATSKEDFAALQDVEPELLRRACDAVCKLAGARAEDIEGK